MSQVGLLVKYPFKHESIFLSCYFLSTYFILTFHFDYRNTSKSHNLDLIQSLPNKQHLPLEITQNFTVQWADFWRLWQIGIHAKKTLNLTKSKTLDRVDSILRVS